MERQLNEQWVLEINGVKHMVKAVEGICIDCFLENGSRCTRSDECPAGDQGDYIIKDLGILNDDGLLPCPFCGEYPLVENAYEGVSGHNTPDGFWRISCFGKNHEMAFFSGKTRQQAIDAWNRRA
jgi:hypothetical protein